MERIKIFAHNSVPEGEIWVNPTFYHSQQGGNIIADMELKITNVARANSGDRNGGPASNTVHDAIHESVIKVLGDQPTSLEVTNRVLDVLGKQHHT